MQALIDYLETLEVTQGEGVGKPFPLFPWERRNSSKEPSQAVVKHP